MAYDFNGTTGKILGTGAALSGLPGTICAWVRPDVTNSEREIAGVSRSSNANPLYRLRMTSTGKASTQFRGDTGGDANATGTTTLSTSAYQHVLGTFGVTGTSIIYYNGAQEGTTGVPSSTTITVDQTEIGVLQRVTPAQFWDGAIAEVAMWSVILDAGEISALAKGVSPLLIRPASLVFYAPLLRDQIDRKGRALTASGSPAVAAHPRILMPSSAIVGFETAGGGGGTVRDLAGSIALQTAFAGSSGIVFGVSGAIAAQTAFNGALRATFAVQGAIQAQTTFAGNLTVTAGAQPGVKDLAGSIAVQTAFNAALKQRLVIAGSFAPQFAFTGALVGNVVAIDLTGSISAAVTFGSIDIETESNSWAPQSPGSELWTTASNGSEIWTVQGPGAEVWIRQ